MVFSTTAEIVFHMNTFSSQKDILNALNLHYMGGDTNTDLALRKAREEVFTSANGDRVGVRNIIVLVTDGRSSNLTHTWSEAKTLRSQGVTILGVGVCFELWDCEELDFVASGPVSKNVLRVRNINQLPDTLDSLTRSMCNGEFHACIHSIKNTSTKNTYIH